MRRRDFIGAMYAVAVALPFAAAAHSVQAQERAEQHRIAIVIASGPVARLDDPTSHAWHAFWEELGRHSQALSEP
jgi:hypothetical protein